jgi:PNKP adenylyltransferase domain, ligase domain
MEDLKKLKLRIDWFCENKVNAFSPTISPAPKSFVRKEIESISEGFKYYIVRGINEFVVQKKYMGSYCDIYLHKNLEETYFVSRNGHRIKNMDYTVAQAACKELHGKFDWTDLEMLIIQSELLPWKVLGKGLISNEFEGYLNAHKNHHAFLSESHLYEKIEAVKSSDAFQEFIAFKENHSEKEQKAKYPAHIARQYLAAESFKVIDLEKYTTGIEIYADQIAHFGKDDELSFKPFNILKKVFSGGKEEIVNDNLSYKDVNNDEFIHLTINNLEEIDEKSKPVYEWFSKLAGDKEEGIVIKPRAAFIKDIPPAFKVRNNHYLVMIYGINFLEEFEYNITKRNISKKVECSTNDWMINWAMLKVKYHQINTENYLLKNLVYDRIMGEKIEATIDTRL